MIPWDEVPCIGQQHLFFPVDAETPGDVQARNNQAKRICRTCPNRLPCLEQALERNEQGVWGGTTDGDRQQIRRNRDDVRAMARRGVHGPQAARFLADHGWAA